MSDRFEWDEHKAITNLRKHSVSFEEAVEAITDPDAVVIRDEAHSVHEDRFQIIGLSARGILSVIFVDRQSETVCRIISARRASRMERDLYHEKKKN